MSAAMQEMRRALDDAPKGRTFDGTYITMQVQAHQATLDELKQAESAARNEELRRTVREAIPVVQRHLARAGEIQSQLRSASGDTTTGGATSKR